MQNFDSIYFDICSRFEPHGNVCIAEIIQYHHVAVQNKDGKLPSLNFVASLIGYPESFQKLILTQPQKRISAPGLVKIVTEIFCAVFEDAMRISDFDFYVEKPPVYLLLDLFVPRAFGEISDFERESDVRVHPLSRYAKQYSVLKNTRSNGIIDVVTSGAFRELHIRTLVMSDLDLALRVQLAKKEREINRYPYLGSQIWLFSKLFVKFDDVQAARPAGGQKDGNIVWGKHDHLSAILIQILAHLVQENDFYLPKQESDTVLILNKNFEFEYFSSDPYGF